MATILVVEDEEAIRQLVSVVLEAAGHEVIAASNGVEGIALFRSSPDRFALILTDLKMPVMDGYQLIDLARRTRAKVKVICMSGYRDEPLPANVEFLQKPFLPDVLRACVSELLKRG
jgi:two-component system, cell cycle sensor histidine kinase and response regulator CckA